MRSTLLRLRGSRTDSDYRGIRGFCFGNLWATGHGIGRKSVRTRVCYYTRYSRGDSFCLLSTFVGEPTRFDKTYKVVRAARM